MDYWVLNNIIRKDCYHLLLFKETLSSIIKVKYFTKLDITIIFYKIRIVTGLGPEYIPGFWPEFTLLRICFISLIV